MAEAALAEKLLAWYDRIKDQRALPWRGEKDPYRIWISEIMLQQTRAEAVKGYYSRFLSALPDIAALAECDDDSLRKLWEGLGYYSRVRNLKKAAQIILAEHNGIFPSSYEKIRALPGIGDYTAGAVCSIAFGQKTPAVDGNVLRVLARLHNDASPIDRPEAKAAAREELASLYPERAGDFTQALMELGATLCGPNRRPACDTCPWEAECQAKQAGTAECLPVKAPKKAQRIEELTVFILSCNDSYALLKRPEHGLLAGLWEYPNTPEELELADALTWVQSHGMEISEVYRTAEKRHDFTHIRWRMRGYYLEVRRKADGFTWFTRQELQETAALPTAFRMFSE